MSIVEDKLAIVVLTFNNAKHIAKSLHSIKGYCDIYTIDSGSDDNTLKIAEPFSKLTRVNLVKPWNAGTQRNFAYGLIRNKYRWILFLDSDEGLSEKLKYELSSIINDSSSSELGYSIRSKYRILGRELNNISRNTYHDRLIRGDLNIEDIFTSSPGEVFKNRNKLSIATLDEGYWHDVDAKGVGNWVRRVSEYQFQNGVIDSEFFCSKSKRDVKNFSFIRRNRIFLSVFLPFLYLTYYIFVRRAFLDGLHGIFFAIIMSTAYILYPFGFFVGLYKRLLGTS